LYYCSAARQFSLEQSCKGQNMASAGTEKSMDGVGIVQPDTQYGGALLALGTAVGFGSLVVVIFSAQSQGWRAFVSVISVGFLVCSASLLIGSLVGFLFGIPRSLEKLKLPREGADEKALSEPTGETTRYRPNTNLEDISDWLTKILVGVGLTQVDSIRAALRSTGQLIAPALGGFQSSEVFALGGLLYFSTCGFFIGFLWARLTLPRLYLVADLRAAERKGVEAGVKLGTEKFLDSTTKGLAERGTVQEVRADRFALWVDNNPQGNSRERALMEQMLGLSFKDVISTDEALEELESSKNKYSIIISDISRPEGEEAGFDLLKKLKKKEFSHPLIFYTGLIQSGDEEKALSLGAKGITTSPQKLFDLVRNALSS